MSRLPWGWGGWLIGALVLAGCAVDAPTRDRAAAVPAAPPPALVAPTQSIPSDGMIVVGQQDTIFDLARQYGVPVRSIIDANRLTPPFQLRPGQHIRIPQPRYHVVAKGDTVFGLARRYQIDQSTLVRMNGLGPPYVIRVGQSLFLPAQPEVQEAAMPAVAVASVQTVQLAEPAAAAPQNAPPTALPPPPTTAATAPSAPSGPNPQPAPAGPRRLGAIAKPPARSGRPFLWPVRGRVVSDFGSKSEGSRNDGVNIAAPRGSFVRAAENGIVAYSGNELGGFGNLLLIRHSDGWITAYAHNETLLVRRGDRVERGQAVARVGSTGNVKDPQLHFEIRRGKQPVDPNKHLETAALDRISHHG